MARGPLRGLRDAALRAGFLVAALYFLAIYVVPGLRHHQRFQLQNFDYGILYHSTWRLAQGLDSFLPVRGVHTWADNQEYFQWLLVPLHLLPGTPYLMLGAHGLALWGCGVVAYRALPGGGAVALLAAGFVWSSTFLRNASLDLFHVESFSTLLLLSLYLACREGWQGRAALSLLLALSCKEDVALTTATLLAFVAARPREFRLPRRWALAGIGLSLGVLVLNLFVVLPHYREATCARLGVEPPVEDALAPRPVSPFFAELPEKLARPGFYAERLARPELGAYLARLLWPALVAVPVAPLAILLPLPAAFANALADGGYFVEGFWHYDHASFGMVAVAVLHALPRLRRGCLWAGLLVAGNLVVAGTAHPPPRVALRAPLEASFWDLRPETTVLAARELARSLPADAAVSADYTSLNYLAERPGIYMYPNPFLGAYFGIAGACEGPLDVPVDVVLLRDGYPQREEIAGRLERDYETWIVSLEGGEFRFRVLLRRASPRAAELRRALHNFPLGVGTSYREGSQRAGETDPPPQ